MKKSECLKFFVFLQSGNNYYAIDYETTNTNHCCRDAFIWHDAGKEFFD